MAKQTQTYAFQAEINQLMSLIINTFYSNKDIFLRELISNASDAIDKAKYKALSTNEGLREYNILITPNKDEKTLTIEDNGVGMSKEDMVNCLGTIANSGTKQFMEALQAGTDVSMIGQFGVGFYSAYLVANTVKVYSGNHCWYSEAGGSFTIEELESPATENGTRLVLELKEDCVDYIEEDRIKDIIKKHSEFIDHPIKLWTKRTESREEEDDEEEEMEDGKVQEVNDTKKKTKTVTEEIEEWKQLNTQKPIWMRKADEVTQEEYGAFYKSLTSDWDDHMAVKHFNVEGQIEFKSLLYVPKRAPMDLFHTKKRKTNMKLFVKRVFIMDECDDIMPEWLNFVSGVVDSEDLPLNVSREMLQQNKIMNVIKKNIVKKCIELFNEIADDEDKSKYKTFYEQYHQNLKLGVHEDSTNRDKLIKLLRFESLKNTEKISLEEYVDGMSEGQDTIYYITGESRKAVENSPFVKGVKSKGFDVLFLVNPIDEYMVQQIRDFDDKKLVNISKDNTVFHEDNKEYEDNLCKRIKEVLEVEKVVVSTRLENDPCCLVSSEYGWSANMERIMKAQTLQNNMNSFMMSGKKIMEINPKHKMIQKLQDGIKNTSMSDKTIKDVLELMYDTALLSSGYSHEDPSTFSQRIYKMISLGLDVLPEEEEVVETEEEESSSTMEEVD